MEEKKNNTYGTVAEIPEAAKPEQPRIMPEEEPPIIPKQQHSILGITFIMLGAFSFSVMFLLVKLMADANTFTLVFYRSLVQIAISLGTLIYEGKNPLGPPEVRWLLIMRAVFGAAAVCAWFFGIQVLPLPDAVTLQFTTPPFAAAFAVFMVGERWMPLDIVGAVVCLTGVALIAHPTWLFGKQEGEEDQVETPAMFMKALAVMVTTGGAALAGIAYVCVRKIGDRASAVVMVLYYGSLSIPMVILGSGLLEGTWKVWAGTNFTFKDYVLLFLMGIAGYGGQWFTNLGLQNETAATATLATSTQIVWTYVFELLFLHETLNRWSLCGTALIVGYMLIVAGIKIVSARVLAAEAESEEVPLLPTAQKKLLERQSSSFTSDYGEYDP